jgi:hypothetical protein
MSLAIVDMLDWFATYPDVNTSAACLASGSQAPAPIPPRDGWSLRCCGYRRIRFPNGVPCRPSPGPRPCSGSCQDRRSNTRSSPRGGRPSNARRHKATGRQSSQGRQTSCTVVLLQAEGGTFENRFEIAVDRALEDDLADPGSMPFEA